VIHLYEINECKATEVCKTVKNTFYVYVKGKGKAIPLQAWTGPESFRRLRFPHFKTIGT